MDDRQFLRCLERIRDLPRNGQGLVQRNRILSDPVGQRRTLNQFENQRLRRLTIGWSLLESVNTADVWMIQ
jgi:hypothetical protein